ncbi:YafY family protein [Paenibacillus sp. GYB004]|uniref:helix-turn-helix transcriptional regulator n=1 Tax=Paenibacillus sp. GYB004 TaxID=2994393 RepID=UPI002F961428
MLKSQRLVQLIMRVNALKSFTVQQLADEFGLSARTITRDLQELSELGVPVYSVQGRGGGYRLLQERILPPIAFTEGEAVAMFVACQSLNNLSALPFDEGAESALHKFYHYLPVDVRERIDRLKQKVAILSPSRTMIPECLRTLLQAIMIRCVVTIGYSSSQGVKERNIQPIGLYASGGYWYCPAYCFLREEVRLFRADRIRSAVLNESMEWREEADQWDLWNRPENVDANKIPFTVSLTRNGVRQLESDEWFGPSLVVQADGGGKALIRISPENMRFYADHIWRLGADARIVEPAEAVEYMQRKIESLKSVYANNE